MSLATASNSRPDNIDHCFRNVRKQKRHRHSQLIHTVSQKPLR